MAITEALDADAPAEEVLDRRALETDPLRWLVDSYYQAQKVRIQLRNRMAAVERNADLGPVPASVELMHARLQEAEKLLVKDMEDQLAGHVAMPWLDGVRGIGPTLAAKLLGLIGDVERFATVSKLWRFAGYAVIDGKRERPVKGVKLTYSIRLKTVVYLCGASFLKSGGPYRGVYDRAKERYERDRPDWTKGHRHLAAMRKMEKLFLSHLWETWREAEGLVVRVPYALEQGGHTTFIDPWEFSETKKPASL